MLDEELSPSDICWTTWRVRLRILWLQHLLTINIVRTWASNLKPYNQSVLPLKQALYHNNISDDTHASPNQANCNTSPNIVRVMRRPQRRQTGMISVSAAQFNVNPRIVATYRNQEMMDYCCAFLSHQVDLEMRFMCSLKFSWKRIFKHQEKHGKIIQINYDQLENTMCSTDKAVTRLWGGHTGNPFSTSGTKRSNLTFDLVEIEWLGEKEVRTAKSSGRWSWGVCNLVEL